MAIFRRRKQDAASLAARFWEEKSLDEMTPREWEALCDGCGKCCIMLLEDADTGEVWETDVACRLFDQSCRRCSDYANRREKVPGCVQLTPGNVEALSWMPKSCAYRRLAEGKGLADWHPLVSGEADSVARTGIAVKLPLAREQDLGPDDIEDHVTVRRTKGHKAMGKNR